MSDEFIDRVQQLFLAALDIPDEQRESWLFEQCGDDQRLVDEIRSLLRHDSPSNDLLEDPVEELIAEAGGLANHRPEKNKGEQKWANITAFHVRCPHCHNPIEFLEEAPFMDIECPSCGSSFSLLGDDKRSSVRNTPPVISNFVLLEPVGIGAFGSVWKAHDQTLDRLVAIKIPRRGLLGPNETEQFLREARSVARLKHPNIVAVHEVGREDNHLYIVSDFIEGSPLSNWLLENTLTPREAAKLTCKIAEALDHAHEAGVIHRDLKPSNIMMDSESEPHLVDFGLAKRDAGEITMTADGKILGTPAYMSPEQAKGQAHIADRRSDVYSLGVILFEMLTGERPFRGDHQMLLKQVLNDEPVGPTRINASTPRDLDTICLKCLEKQPSKRYTTAQELSDDLRRHLRGDVILARPIGSLGRSWRWACRRPAHAGLLATAVVSLLSIVAVGVSHQYQERLETANRQLNSTNEGLEKTNIRLNDALEQLDRVQYARLISAAHAAWKNNNVERAEQLLWQCSPGRRHWEWYHIFHLCHSELLTLNGHTSAVKSVAFSPNSKQIVSGSQSDGLRVWDSDTGQETHSLEHGLVTSVAFSPTGSQFASASYSDDNIKLWNVVTGEEMFTLEGNFRNVFSVAYSPDGNRLASATEGAPRMLRVWNTETGRELYRVAEPGICCVAYSPDGHRIAGGCARGKILVWDASTGQEILKITDEGNRYFNKLAFSPDGQRLIGTGGNSTIKMWNLVNGLEMLSMEGHSASINCVTYSPDGTRIASASDDKTVKVWDAKTGNEQLTIRLACYVNSVAFSSDGSRIVSGGGKGTGTPELKVWDAVTGQEPPALEGHKSEIARATFSPDGKEIASASEDKTVKVWDAKTGIERLTLDGHTRRVEKVAFSSDGRKIFSGTNKTMRVWDAATGQEIESREISDNVYNSSIMAFSSDGKKVITAKVRPQTSELAKMDQESARLAKGEPNLKVWDTAMGQETLTLETQRHSSFFFDATFSADGQSIVSVSLDGSVNSWDATSGKETPTYANPRRRHHRIEGGVLSGSWEGIGASCVAISSDGRWIASGGYDDLLHVWDADTGLEPLTLEGHTDDVLSVAFSPDAQRIVSGCADGTLKLWDLTTGLEVITLNGHSSEVWSVAFSPNGGQIVSGGSNGSLRIWNSAGHWDGIPPSRFHDPFPEPPTVWDPAPLTSQPR